MQLTDFFSQPYIVWFIIGLILLLLEFAIPGLVVLFFGLGAWITALVTLIADPGINLQLILFISSSVLSLLLLRKYFKKIFYGNVEDSNEDAAEELIGKVVEVTQTISKNKNGKVLFKGAAWSAKSEEEIKKGESAEIIGKDSITLLVKPYK